MSVTKTDKRQERMDELASMIAACQSETTLESWNAFCETLQAPMELLPALMTGRTELLNVLPPRALSEPECAAMFAVIKELIRTNVALRVHAERTAQLVDQWSQQFRALSSLGQRIDDFANFRQSDDDEQET